MNSFTGSVLKRKNNNNKKICVSILRNKMKSSSSSMCTKIMFITKKLVILWWKKIITDDTLFHDKNPWYNFWTKHKRDCQLLTLSLLSYIYLKYKRHFYVLSITKMFNLRDDWSSVYFLCKIFLKDDLIFKYIHILEAISVQTLGLFQVIYAHP